jgi:predicted flap endonuclease-1-like 5' DNA nuclease
MTVSYSIAELDTLQPGIATKFRSFGIRTTGKLLEMAKDPKGRQELAERTGLSPQCLLRFANYADKMRIKGIGEDYAELLEAAGVDTVRELKYRNPANLAKRMAEVNKRLKLVRALPSEKVVLRWIETAKKLPIKISY